MRSIFLYCAPLALSACASFTTDHYSPSDGTGGSSSSYSDPYAAPYPPSPPEGCAPPSSEWSAMQRLHADTEESVHELIKCGGLQARISRTFLIIVVASNRSLFDEAAYRDLVNFAATYDVDLTVPLTDEGAGRWSMPIIPLTDSKFSLTFHDPVTKAVIKDNPFVMDSYLKGAVATSSLTLDQMKANLTERSTISFAWEGKAALAGVLNHRAEIPDPFTITISFADLAQWLWGIDLSPGSPDLGPLDALFDLEADSQVVLSDDKNGTTVDYDVAGLSATLREIGNRGVSFQVNHIDAHRGPLMMDGTASALRYDAASGHLNGTFTYRVHGESGDLIVTDVYNPVAGLSTSWSCPHAP